MKPLRMLGWLALAGALSSCDRARESNTCSVQYRVTGTARRAAVKYRLPQGTIEERTVSLPFTTARCWFHIPSPASIEARNMGASGDLRVEILVAGQPDPLVFGSHGIGSYTTNAYGIVRANCDVGVR